MLRPSRAACARKASRRSPGRRAPSAAIASTSPVIRAAKPAPEKCAGSKAIRNCPDLGGPPLASMKPLASQPNCDPARAPHRISTIRASADPLAPPTGKQRSGQRGIRIGGGLAFRIHRPAEREWIRLWPWRRRFCCAPPRTAPCRSPAARGPRWARRMPGDRCQAAAAFRHERPWRWACWHRGRRPAPPPPGARHAGPPGRNDGRRKCPALATPISRASGANVSSASSIAG